MTNQTRRKSSEFEGWRSFHIVYFPEAEINFDVFYDWKDLKYSAHIANQAILNMMVESK